MHSLKKCITGNVKKQVMLRAVLMPGFVLPAILLFIAYLQFPDDAAIPYTFKTSTISRLGWPVGNPNGWYWFNMAMIVFGFTMVPITGYLRRTLYQGTGNLGKAATFLHGIGACGLFLLGAIPNFPNLFGFHAANATLTFGGLALGNGAAAMIVVKHQQHSTMLGKWLFTSLVIYSFASIGIAGLLAILNNGGYYMHDPSTPLVLSMAFWEWQAMVTLIGAIAVLLSITPDKEGNT